MPSLPRNPDLKFAALINPYGATSSCLERSWIVVDTSTAGDSHIAD